VKQTTCQNCWPRFISVIKLREAWFQGFFLAAPAANFRKRDISRALERAFLDFFGDFFVAELPQKEAF